mgnify:CR=1 FL=1
MFGVFKARSIDYRELEVYRTVIDKQLDKTLQRALQSPSSSQSQSPSQTPAWVVFFSPSGIEAVRQPSVVSLLHWSSIPKAALGDSTSSDTRAFLLNAFRSNDG